MPEAYTITLELHGQADVRVKVGYEKSFPDGALMGAATVLDERVYGNLWVAQQQANAAIGRHRKRLEKSGGAQP